MPEVHLSPAFRPLTDDTAVVTTGGANVGEVIADLERRFPGMMERLCTEGALRPGLAVVVNGSVSSLGLLEPVPPDAEIHFLPAIGGG